MWRFSLRLCVFTLVVVLSVDAALAQRGDGRSRAGSGARGAAGPRGERGEGGGGFRGMRGNRSTQRGGRGGFGGPGGFRSGARGGANTNGGRGGPIGRDRSRRSGSSAGTPTRDMGNRSRRGSGGGGFDMGQMANRMTSMMDRNRDGQIDRDEMSRVPERLRQRMGIGNAEAMSVSELREKTTASFQRRMEQRNQDRASESRTSSGASIFQQSPRQKLVGQLPAEYRDRDADGDGQVALYEWAAWRRSELDEFFGFDLNDDGFLTAKELTRTNPEAGGTVAFNRERLAISGSSSSGRGSNSSRLRISGSTSAVAQAGQRSSGSRSGSRAGTGRAQDGAGSDRGRGRDRSRFGRGSSFGGSESRESAAQSGGERSRFGRRST